MSARAIEIFNANGAGVHEFNDDYCHFDWRDKSQAVPTVELEPTIGYTLTFDKFTSFHYSEEGFPPRNQMARQIRFLHTLLPDKFTYFLDTKSIHPLISERARSSYGISSLVTPEAFDNAHPSSLECDMLMKASSGAKLSLFMLHDQDIFKVRTGLIESLNQAVKSGKAIRQKAGNSDTKKWVYQLKDPNDAIEVESLGRKEKQVTKRQPYIIIEEGKEVILGVPKLSIKIAADSGGDYPTIEENYAFHRTLFEIEIKSEFITTTRENILFLQARGTIHDGDFHMRTQVHLPICQIICYLV